MLFSNRFILSCSLACLTIGFSIPVAAQVMFRSPGPARSARFIEPPRRIQQTIREAERAIDEQQYSDAVVRLGDMLQRDITDIDDLDLSGQDFFLLPDSSEGNVPVFRESLFRTARDMIATLPTEARETYRLRYGPLAQKMLGEAAPTRNWTVVEDVRRKYFHTNAGYEASLLLAHRAMTQGRPLSASLLLDDVVTQPDAIEHLGEAIKLVHAAALQLSGRELSAAESSLSVNGAITVKGDRLSAPRPDDVETWITSRYRVNANGMPNRSRDYKMFGAKPNRNDLAVAEMPIANPRWMKQTVASPRQERAIGKVAEDLASSGKLPPPSWTPLRVGNQLLMKTTERLFGVDFRTGKLVWQYPWFAPYDEFEKSDVAADLFGDTNGPGDLLSQRVWNDLPYGQITSDGERVFMIDDLGEIEFTSFSPIVGIRGTRPSDAATNTLVALDLATEGKLLWRIGAEDDASSLSKAFFLGPPLPLDGRLYIMAELAGDILLVCLDPVSGNEVWRQQLVAVETGGIDLDAVRRVAGATPTYHEGVLICPTGAGALVAIDLVDRMFRWGVNYPRNTEIGHSISGRGRGLEKEQLLQRWHSGTAIASGDTVLVTPIESDRLFGFDLVTGNEKFAKLQRIQQRYLAGIQDGKFLVVGSSSVTANDLEKGGAPLWKTAADLIPAGQQISGRGVFGDGEYLLPSTGNQLIRISLDDGSVLERRATRFPLGNLVAVNGQLISQDATYLAVAYGERSLEPRVSRALKENPDDFDALIRKSEILMQRDQRREALELLARARQINPDDDEVLMLSVDAMLGMLRSDLDVGRDFIETLEELIDQPAQRIELLALRIRWAVSKSNINDAMKYLIEFSELLALENSLNELPSQVVNDPSRFCSLNSWLAARFKELWSLSNPQQRSAINQSIRDLYTSHAQSSDSILLMILGHFRASDAADVISSHLVKQYLDDAEYFKLERTCLGQSIPTDEVLEGLSSELLVTLGTAYARGGLGEDAIAVANILSGRNESDASEEAEQIRAKGESIARRQRWDYEKIAINSDPSLKWQAAGSTSALHARLRRIETPPGTTNVIAGRHFREWRLGSDIPQSVAFQDPLGNNHSIPISEMPLSRETSREAIVCGSMMLVMLPNELIAVDLFKLLAGQGESIVWRRSLRGDGGVIAQRISKPSPFGDLTFTSPMKASVAGVTVPEFYLGPVIGDRIVMLQGGDLIALDLMTSEILWRNSAAPSSGVVVCDEERVAVVSPNESTVQFFDILDGRKLQEHPWQHGKVWKARATNVLCYRDDPGTNLKSVQLIDPFTDDVLLKTLKSTANAIPGSESRTYARIIGERFLTMLETTGDALVWDLDQGRSLSGEDGETLSLPAMDDLQSLHGMILGDRLMLLPARRLVHSKLTEQGIAHTFQSRNHFPAHSVHAISTVDGSLLWEKEFDSTWGCTSEQASATPLLILSRSPIVQTRATTVRTLDFYALDVRNGELIQQTLGKEVAAAMHNPATSLTVQPLQGRVLVKVGSSLLSYQFEKSDEN
tara:strand:- start:154357 stop:158934 length:4578 start_codon:yes stop_codon:yes gene_type:complete